LGVAEIEILEYNGKTSYPTASYTKWFDYDRIQRAVFRRREPQDEIILDKEDSFYSKKLSKYMTDEKIPASRRDTMLVLADGNSIIWVPGYRYGSRYKVSSKTKRILAINIINGGFNNG
jgi:tRNA(Ile)-lysidine synthase